MARQQRVQEYLDKNKIGALFEELMGKVISDMPDDPVTFLIHSLQRKAERQDRSHLRRSTGDIDSLAVAKERGYEKPWKTNSKRLKQKQTLEFEEEPKLVRKSHARAEWDGKAKVTATVFDDFWKNPTQTKRTLAGRSPSPARPTTGVSWADPGNEDEELLFRSQGYRGPRRRATEANDPLAGELSLTKETAKTKDSTTATVPQKKPKDQKAAAMRHKKLLEQLILERKQKSDSGIEDDKEQDSDDGIEVMEDLDELQAEGVRKRKPIGMKTVVRMRGLFRRKRPSSEPPMRVSICARCAKMMTGGVPSQPSQPTEVGTAYGELPSYSRDSTRDVRSSKPGPSQSDVRVSPGVDTDDEFESVSQVTGPRKPVWPEDSDTDALTPRKGAHMFASRAIPSKGRPMYSPDIAEFSKKSKTRSSPRASNPGTGRSAAELHTRQSATKNVWSSEQPREPYLSEDDDARNVSRAASGFGQGGTGWSVPTEYDTDTSIYGTTNHPYQTDQRTY